VQPIVRRVGLHLRFGTPSTLWYTGVVDMRLQTARHGRIQVRAEPVTIRGQSVCGHKISFAQRVQRVLSLQTTPRHLCYQLTHVRCRTLAGWWTRACVQAATTCIWPRAHPAAPCGCSCTSTMASQPHGSSFIDDSETFGSYLLNSLFCCFATCWPPCSL
jgi:hypothetical protein